MTNCTQCGGVLPNPHLNYTGKMCTCGTSASAGVTTIKPDNSNVIKNAEAEIERLKKENEDLRHPKYILTLLQTADGLKSECDALKIINDRLRSERDNYKVLAEEATKMVKVKDEEKQYHMNAINHLAKDNGILGLTSDHTVQLVLSRIQFLGDQCKELEAKMQAMEEALLEAENALGFIKIPSLCEDKDRYEREKINQAIIKVRSALDRLTKEKE